jgi:hypothetical protein
MTGVWTRTLLCAWVLWMGMGLLSMGKLTDVRPFEGYGTAAACKDMAANLNR